MKSRARHLGRALRHRNYRLFVAGQSISLIGTWLTRFATNWMAYRLTGSPFILGLVAFCNHVPSTVIGPLAGVLVDRWDRQRVVVLTQVAGLVQSALLAAFAFAGAMEVWHLMLLGAAQGAINAFDMPARQSFLREMIDDRADLPNAIALSSSMVNVAKLTGPAIAAVLVVAVGEAWCFAIDALSYVAVVASLLAIRVHKLPPRPREATVIAELVDGIRYTANLPLVRAILILLAVSSVLGGAYGALLPVVAAEHLRGGPYTLGLLMSSAGIGALTGALYLASRTTVVGLGSVIARCSFGLGAGLVALELATSVWIAAPILYVVGLCLMVQMAATNTIVQTVVDPSKLGRVMSLYAVAFSGGMPIGAFFEGLLASHIGATHTFAIAGAGCMIAALVFRRALPALRIATRPMYVELGLIRPAP